MKNSEKILQLLENFAEKTSDRSIIASPKTVGRFDTQWENAYAFSLNDKASVRRAIELHKKITEAPRVSLNISITDEHLNFITHRLSQSVSNYFRTKMFEMAAKLTIDHLLSVDLVKAFNASKYYNKHENKLGVYARKITPSESHIYTTFKSHSDTYFKYYADTICVKQRAGRTFTPRAPTMVRTFIRQEKCNVQLSISNDQYQRLVSVVIHSQPEINTEISKSYVEEFISSTLNVSQPRTLFRALKKI
jgi:hypothetical protein